MFYLPQIKGVVEELAAIRGLKTKFFNGWAPELDEALALLPEAETFPHGLFRLLMQMADAEKRRIILVTRWGEPIALAGLRNRWGGWEPITQWIVPGVVFPVKKPEYVPKVLAVIGLPIRVSWWRLGVPPPHVPWIKNAISTPTYGMDCGADFEQYWRDTGFFKNVRKYRNRCKGFALRINFPKSREWTIKNWGAKWRRPELPEMPDLAEKLAASEYLENRGSYFTLSLHDGSELAAGITFLADRNCAVAHINYRDPKYDWNGAMDRLMELSFFWAKERGFETIDLGGSFDYKARWAPEKGQKWEFDVFPRRTRFKEKASQLWRNLAGAPGRIGSGPVALIGMPKKKTPDSDQCLPPATEV